MKKIILFAVLSFMGLFAHAQTQIPYPAFTTNVDNVNNIGGGLYDLTVSVTDQSGKYTGTAIDTVDFVFWQNCRRYTIDSVLVKFSSQAIVRVNDNDGSGAPIAGEAVIMKESPSGIGHFVSGILASRNQCIASYYTALIGTGTGGQDTFYLADGTIIVSGDTLPQMVCSDERLSAPFLSTDRALLSAVDAENADVVFLFINGLFYDDTEYAVSGDTLIFNDYVLESTDTILVRACQNAVGSNFAATLNDVLSNGTNAGGLKIENIGAPTNNADAATKEYVDNNNVLLNIDVDTANYNLIRQADGTVVRFPISLPELADTTGLVAMKGATVFFEDFGEHWSWDGNKWAVSGFTPPLPLADLAQDGANINDAVRWNGSEWVAAPVNSIEYLTENIEFTICNNADSCDFTSLAAAYEAATFFATVFDSTSESRIIIRIRPNPDGSPTVLSKGVLLNNFNLGAIKITSAWADTISTFQYNGNGGSTRFLFESNFSSSFIVDSLSVQNVGSVNNRAFRIVANTSLNINKTTVDGFNFGMNVIATTGIINECVAKNGSQRGFWIQGTGNFRFQNCEAFNNGTTGIDFQNAYMTVFRPKAYNNGTNLSVLSSALSFNTQAVFEGDTLSNNQNWGIRTNAIISLNNQGTIDSALNEGYRLGSWSNGYFITNSIDPVFDFMNDSVPPNPAFLNYYTDTSTGENMLKIEQDSQWVDVGLPSILPQKSVTINADSNNLIINNLGIVAFQNLNALTEVQSGIAASAFSSVPTQMFRYEGVDTAWVRMTQGVLQLRDKTGSYVLDDLVNAEQTDSITTEVSTTTTAVMRTILPVDCSGGAVTINPPASPTNGDWFAVLDSGGDSNINNITIDFVTATQNLSKTSQNFILNTESGYVRFTYSTSTNSWHITN